MSQQTKVLPDHVLTKMAPEERAKLGKGGITAIEAQTVYSNGQEKQLQKDIAAFLKHIPHVPYVIQSPFGKKTLNPGQADFVLCYRGRFVSLEAKCGTNKQSQDQINDELRVRTARGLYRVVQSVTDVKEFLNWLDDQIDKESK